MLIVEELFLLLRRDDGKSEKASAYNGYGLSAVVISDLILGERVTVDERKDPRLSVVRADPTGSAVLDAALARLSQKDGKKLSALVSEGKLNPETTVAAALAERGIIGIEEKRMLGLVPARYPVLDPTPERAARERLRTVLAGGTPTPGDAALLSILQGIDVVGAVLEEEKGTLGRKDLKRRIEEVSQEAVAGLAVGRAVQAANAAIMTAVFVPVIVSTTTT